MIEVISYRKLYQVKSIFCIFIIGLYDVGRINMYEIYIEMILVSMMF